MVALQRTLAPFHALHSPLAPFHAMIRSLGILLLEALHSADAQAAPAEETKLQSSRSNQSAFCALQHLECTLLRQRIDALDNLMSGLDVVDVQSLQKLEALDELSTACQTLGPHALQGLAEAIWQARRSLLPPLLAHGQVEALSLLVAALAHAASFLSSRDVAIKKMVQLEAEMHGLNRRIAGYAGEMVNGNNSWWHFDPNLKACPSVTLWDDRISHALHPGVVAATDRAEGWIRARGGLLAPRGCQYGRRTSHRRVAWMPLDSGSGWSCDDAHDGAPLSLADADVELFCCLAEVFPSPKIFMIGNGHGYGTMVLADVFPHGRIDVLTLGGDQCLDTGIRWAREFLHEAGVEGSVVEGASPHATADAAEGRLYDIVVIDGDHNQAAVVADFAGIYPFLAPRSVVVFHDGRYHFEVATVINSILEEFGSEFSHHMWHGEFYRNLQATSFLHRGLDMHDLHKFRTMGKRGITCSN